MSYVPKYVLKRMVANDAVKLVGDNIEITIINLIMDIPTSEIPNYVGNLLEKMDMTVDGEVVCGIDFPDVAAKARLWVDDKEYTFDNLVDSGVIPTNAKMKFVVPNVKGLKVGETHKFGINLKIPEMPINTEIEREVCE
ncbi:MAG: hypothetical protein ACFFCS_12790 [Candidatus Hodarchaeota archaeon]